ncbi:Intradiol ring-cleavage dioxygenase [Melanogaster broomeanus]|nr:Intradiol ring-cleavage dioxygenase [Melanogaster broomeanus]
MSDFDQTRDDVKAAVSNGISPPNFELPIPDSPDIITANLLKLVAQTPNPRLKFIYQLLVQHIHTFVKETNLSTDEWMAAITFLTSVGQKCTGLRQEMILLSDVLGVSALVDSLNNPVGGGATENSVLGPFYTDDAEELELGDSIASEGKGRNMYVEGRILTTGGEPIPNAVIETWEADHNGFYDTQYTNRTRPTAADDCGTGRRKLWVSCRRAMCLPHPRRRPRGAAVDLSRSSQHAPNHLHMMVEAPGYHKLITALYPEVVTT